MNENLYEVFVYIFKIKKYQSIIKYNSKALQNNRTNSMEILGKIDKVTGVKNFWLVLRQTAAIHDNFEKYIEIYAQFI